MVRPIQLNFVQCFQNIFIHVYAAPEIAIDDLSSLESEFLALQHSVQK